MRIAILILPIWLLILCNCTSTEKRDYKFIEIPAVINANPNKALTEEEVSYDIEQLKFSLNNVYSGRYHLPKNEFSVLISKISQIKGPISAQTLCTAIDSYLDLVSDNHLNAKFNDKSCFNKKISKENFGVGKNFYQEKDLPWSVKTQSRGNDKALLISITSFHKRSSPVWDGLLDKVKSMLPSVDLVILDMRGNGGGDDQIGYELSALLAGSNIKTPYTEQWTNNSPETFQIFVNTFEYWARLRKSKGEEVPPYILKLKKDFEEKRDKALTGEKVPLGDMQGDAERERTNFDYDKSIKKPIYILIDAKCGSSCESTTDYFEMNTLVKTVGENTAGYIHFGNNGNVFLKNSGIKIQMAVSFNSYQDGRFLEKKGITPKIQVPAGKDAMDYAWKDFLTGKGKKND